MAIRILVVTGAVQARRRPSGYQPPAVLVGRLGGLGGGGGKQLEHLGGSGAGKGLEQQRRQPRHQGSGIGCSRADQVALRGRGIDHQHTRTRGHDVGLDAPVVGGPSRGVNRHPALEIHRARGDQAIGIGRGVDGQGIGAAVAGGAHHDHPVFHGRAGGDGDRLAGPVQALGGTGGAEAYRRGDDVHPQPLHPFQRRHPAVAVGLVGGLGVDDLAEHQRRLGSHPGEASRVEPRQQRQHLGAVLVLAGRVSGLVGHLVVVTDEVVRGQHLRLGQGPVLQGKTGVEQAHHHSPAGKTAGVQVGNVDEFELRQRAAVVEVGVEVTRQPEMAGQPVEQAAPPYRCRPAHAGQARDAIELPPAALDTGGVEPAGAEAQADPAGTQRLQVRPGQGQVAFVDDVAPPHPRPAQPGTRCQSQPRPFEVRRRFQPAGALVAEEHPPGPRRRPDRQAEEDKQNDRPLAQGSSSLRQPGPQFQYLYINGAWRPRPPAATTGPARHRPAGRSRSNHSPERIQ